MSGMPWFRLYSRIIDDKKLKLLAFEDRWHFVALCALKCSGELDEPDMTLRIRQTAIALGLDRAELDTTLRRLREVKLIDEEMHPISWDSLQFKNDTSAERTRKWRAKKAKQKQASNKNVTGCDVTVTVQDTDTDTDTDIRARGVSTPAPEFSEKDFVEAWNQVAAECGLSRIRKMTEGRKRAFRVRRNEYPAIDDWKRAFTCLRSNKWMHGEGRNGWRADPDFFLQAKSFTKLVEGQYDQAS